MKPCLRLKYIGICAEFLDQWTHTLIGNLPNCPVKFDCYLPPNFVTEKRRFLPELAQLGSGRVRMWMQICLSF